MNEKYVAANGPRLAVGTRWQVRSRKRIVVEVVELSSQFVVVEARTRTSGKPRRTLSRHGFLQGYRPMGSEGKAL